MQRLVLHVCELDAGWEGGGVGGWESGVLGGCEDVLEVLWQRRELQAMRMI